MNLYLHQKNALEQTKDRNRCAYFFDMGLGKTFIGAEKMRSLNTRLNIIVCQKSKIADWMDHFQTYYPVDFTTINFTKNSYLTSDDINSYSQHSRIVLVVNYELAWLRPSLLELEGFTLMLDESSLIQNTQANRTEFIMKMRPSNVILLSGTPCSGQYENLWSQARLLGWDISQQAFDNTYINWSWMDFGQGHKRLVDKNRPYKSEERLKRKFREHGAVFLKTEDCIELPEQTFTKVNIQISQSYRQFMRDRVVTVKDKTLVGDTILTHRLYARQLCAQYSVAKLDTFKDMLDSTADRLIVFYNFNEERDLLTNIVEETRGRDRCSLICGDTKNLTAYTRYEDSVTLVQYQAGSMGLNLQLANKVIYFSLPERSDLFEQSKKRIHRIGQERPCFYWYLICKGSVEEGILKALKQKKDYTDELFKEELK